jgi:hypothetical protein
MNLTHGLSKVKEFRREYSAWMAMRERCNKPTGKMWHRYGGRGIVVCAAWDDFLVFLHDVGRCPPGMTLDRIDNNGPYEPGNCRWATRKEQARNRSDSVLITAFGQRKICKDWAAYLKIPYGTLGGCIRRGLSIEEVIQKRALVLPSGAAE